MTKNLLENTGHGSLGNKIFTVLRDKILNEEYTQGQKLNEVALSKELNISRTPIREALKQLELEGLVKSIPNKGVYVLGFSHRDIDDMLEIRYALEGLAIQLAIERINDEELEKIKEVYDLMEFYAEKGFVNEPQRCKACRQARKNAAKPARELFETTCAECGGVAKIPFKPMEGKSYYCSDCFAKRK